MVPVFFRLLLVWIGWAVASGAWAAGLEPYNSESSDLPLSDPGRALKQIDLPEGFRASLFAHEPMVRQPIGMTFDSRGRLWVVENNTYAEGSLRFDARLRDRILILEDADRDGVAENSRVFWDDGVRMTSAAPGFGGVWVLAAPRLLFIPDRDGDDQPDGEPEVLLDGFDSDQVHHNVVNGLKWGPDGWLYGRHGILAASWVGRPGAEKADRVMLDCGIWRYHPLRRTFEIVARGGTNPWGHDWDDYGELFFINTVIGHLWHAIPGAYYERMYGEHANPHLYSLIGQTADHYHWDTGEKWSDIRRGMSSSTSDLGGGHAHCGFMIYLGDNWPRRWRGEAFTLNLHGRRINQDHLERRGAGYVGTHRRDFVTFGDPWFRGVELIYGPDGAVYVADWSDVGECHESTGVHRSSGRIFRIQHGDEDPAMEVDDVGELSNLRLVEFQMRENEWAVREARRVLQERHGRGVDVSDAVEALRGMFGRVASVPRKLRALWCLFGVGAADDPWLIELLGHEDEHIRSWAVRLLADRGEFSHETARALAERAREEPSGLVRVYLASALGRVSGEDRWSLARALCSHETLTEDAVLSRMIWYGIEPLVARDREKALGLANQCRVPLVRRHIARRLATAGD